MNLVAKEYVAAQNPLNPGVLVLSAFAGAARQLDAALLVNPHDVDAVAHAVRRALTMPADERRERWHSMVGKLRTSSVQGWFADFLLALGDARRKPSWPKAQPIVRRPSSRARAQWREWSRIRHSLSTGPLAREANVKSKAPLALIFASGPFDSTFA